VSGLKAALVALETDLAMIVDGDTLLSPGAIGAMPEAFAAAPPSPRRPACMTATWGRGKFIERERNMVGEGLAHPINTMAEPVRDGLRGRSETPEAAQASIAQRANAASRGVASLLPAVKSAGAPALDGGKACFD
jgi:hypothetical protein